MNSQKKYEEALAYATRKHEGQYRIGGAPYILHPIAVAEDLRKQGYDMDYQIAGLFHDLLEDTDATEQEIEAMAGVQVLDVVQRLTKREGYVMAEYVAQIRENPMAMAVKTADRLHNLRCAVVADEKFRRSYILESIDWYLDFSPEIPRAVKILASTLSQPIPTLPEECQ